MSGDLTVGLFLMAGLVLAAAGFMILRKLHRTPGYHDKGIGSFDRGLRNAQRNILLNLLGIGLAFLGVILFNLGLLSLGK